MKQKNPLVEYHGACQYSFGKVATVKQFDGQYTLYISSNQPSIEQITRVWASPKIIGERVVRTAKGLSLEGQRMTGYALMLVGNVEYKVEYVANNMEKSIHTSQGIFPFGNYVVLSEEFVENSFISGAIVIDYIQSNILDCRSIYNHLTMTAIANVG